MFPKKGLLIKAADLDAVSSILNRVVGTNAGIQEGAVLRDRLALNRTEIGQWILAGIVVEAIPANESTKVEDGIGADHMGVERSDVVGLDLCALVRVSEAS